MQSELWQLVQIVFADIILSGDNAIVIGMAAASVAPEHRRMAILLGMGMAAVLRIVFAALATYLMEVPGILVLGGLLLAWVCWRFYRDLRAHSSVTAQENAGEPGLVADSDKRRQLRSAFVTITIADVSMSLDNVLAIAAIARDDRVLLVFGLVLAIALMALCATLIARILKRYPLLSWIGLLLLIYLTVLMLWDGFHDIAWILHWII